MESQEGLEGKALDELQQLAKGIASIAALAERSQQALSEQTKQSTYVIKTSAEQVDQRVARVIEGVGPRLSQLTQQSLDATLAPAVEKFNQRLATTDQALQQASNRFGQAQHAFENTALRRVWAASLAMGIIAVLGIVGAGYMLYAASAVKGEAAQLRSEIAYLDRIRNADLVPCGENDICARIDEKAQKIGDGKQYRVVAERGR